MTLRIFLALGALAFSATPSFAHWGHLGELAGHSHWIGLGATALAAALAAAAGRMKGAEDETAQEPEADEAEAEQTGEEAAA